MQMSRRQNHGCLRVMMHAVAEIRSRKRLQQLPRLRCLRRFEDFFDGAFLHNLSLVHHHHAAADAPYHGKLVGDEQNRHSVLFLKFRQERQNTVSGLCVQRRRGLIENQQVRP